MRSDLMAQWLLGRRWFAGKGRAVADVGVSTWPWLQADPAVRIELVEVRYVDGESEAYQVPVVYRSTPDDALAQALIGTDDRVEGLGPGPWWAYDALHDHEVTGLWLGGMNSGRHEAGEEQRGMRLSYHREPTTDALSTDAPSLVFGGEQSNTSVIFGDEIMLKVFRRITEGVNPDVELLHALAEAGNTYVPALLGWVDGTWAGGPDDEPQTGTLAIASEFLRSASAGWDLAITSVRGLFAEPEGVTAEESGADFAGESYRLGQATAAVHADLARALGSDELSAADLRGLGEQMTDRLNEARAAAPALEPYADQIAKVYADLTEHSGAVQVQRVHGDLHLGQVMRVPTGWRLIDFEGEPARPLAERRAPHSPLKDVAGMMRSFDYAARHLLAEHRPGGSPGGETGSAVGQFRAQEWAERNQRAYCDGYLDVAGVAVDADPVPLQAFVLDKAVYEVVYETRNRPTWIGVPLAAIGHLLGHVG